MAWAFVAASAAVTSTTTSITLAEPAGVLDGDLLIACFSSRSTATTPITGTGWTHAASQNNNNVVVAAATSVASGTMLYQVRSGAPNLTFTIPAGINVCFGRMLAYRGNLASGVLDVTQAVTTPTNTTVVNVAGLTTTVANDLIVAMLANARSSAASSFNATSPAGASGATTTTLAPAELWRERIDTGTITGADTALAAFDGIKATPGATGNFTVTSAIEGGHVLLAAAFKIGAVVIPGVKVWSGSAWGEKPAKVWTGSAWTQKPVKVWTGSAWVNA